MKHPTSHRVRNVCACPGFTMVELLVTVTLVVVLAALSAIGFSRWVKRAKLAASVEQVRNLGVSLLSYAMDKGELPVWHDFNQRAYWWQLLAEANGISDPMIFKSPGDNAFDPENVAQTISYGWNYPVIGRHKGDSGFRTDHVLRLTNFDDPNGTLVLADGPATNCWGYIDGYNNKPDPDRFEGKAAAVFLDGSARVMNTPEDFLPDSKWFTPIKPLIRN